MIRFLFLFFVIFAYTSEKQTICLNMIVKDEAKIICRCLDSVKSIIDYWVIIDTGSSDGTQEIIRNHLKDIPGELYERPWKNWGETRSIAFNLAKGKGDYILFMDADDILEFEEGFSMPTLTADQYNMWRGTQKCSYIKPQIVRGDLPWKWVGVTHEYLSCDEFHTQDLLENVHYTSIDDGATRSTGVAKFLKNVELLEKGMKDEPENSRYAFYLAESYRDSEQYAKALEWYQKRVNMGGWDEEIYWSKLQIGHMLSKLGLPSNIIAEGYKNAFAFRPKRVEAPYYLATLFNNEKEYKKAYIMLASIPKSDEKDILFNEDWINDYGILFQKSICAYYVGNYEEALLACEELLKNKNLPKEWKTLAKENKKYPEEKLKALNEDHCLSNQNGF